MGRFLLYVVPTVVVLYSLIDALQTRRDEVRTLPKWLWLLLILVVPLLGAVAWLYAGRPQSGRGAVDPLDPRRGPVAPDDDPAFLRTLDDATWSQRMRQRRERGAAPTPPVAPAPEREPVEDADGTDHANDSDTTDSADH